MSSPPAAPRVRRGNKWAARFTVAGLGLLMLAAGLVYVTVMLGHVEGEEIATETFQRRTFEYYQLPLIELQVSGITRVDSTGDVEEYLIKDKIISVTKPKTPPDESLRWDLVSANRFGQVFSRGEAEILCHYLDSKNADGKFTWVEWSKKNPELAKIIWPAVVTVARQELYIFVPELLALAANATDPEALQMALDESLSEQYLRVATTQQQLARHELAVELFSHSLERSPRRIVALEGRAASLAALGKQEKAEADLAQARELKRF